MNDLSKLYSIWNLPTDFVFELKTETTVEQIQLNLEPPKSYSLARKIKHIKECGKVVWFFIVNPHLATAYDSLVLVMGEEGAIALKEWVATLSINRYYGQLIDCNRVIWCEAAATPFTDDANVRINSIEAIAKKVA